MWMRISTRIASGDLDRKVARVGGLRERRYMLRLPIRESKEFLDVQCMRRDLPFVTRGTECARANAPIEARLPSSQAVVPEVVFVVLAPSLAILALLPRVLGFRVALRLDKAWEGNLC